MTDRRRPARRAAMLAGLGGLVIGACSDTDVSTSSTETVAVTTSTAPAPVETDAGVTSVVTAAPEVVPVPVAPDPGALLQQALASAAPGYHFVTTIDVAGAIVLTAEGDRVGPGTRLTVSSNDGVVDYVVTPEGSFAGQAGAWQELQDAAPASDPLVSLAAPSAVAISEFDGTRAVVAATYPPTALGLADGQPVTVAVEIVGGVLTSMSYTDPTSNPPATVRTVVTALTDPTPVTVPEAAAEG